jgi:hypothetical protein
MRELLSLMELESALSNLQNLELLRRMSRARARLAAQRRPSHRLSVTISSRPLPLLRTIVRVLEVADSPMPVYAIHRAVEACLGQSVSYASLKHCVSEHARGGRPRLVHEHWGWYRLR